MDDGQALQGQDFPLFSLKIRELNSANSFACVKLYLIASVLNSEIVYLRNYIFPEIDTFIRHVFILFDSVEAGNLITKRFSNLTIVAL